MDYDVYMSDLGNVVMGFVWIIIASLALSFMASIISSISLGIKSNKQRKEFKKNIIRYESLKYRDLNGDKLALLNNPNLNDLKDYFYDIFYRFETAYNRLDYNMMRLLSTPNLYQNYHLLMSLDLKKGNKKVIDEIKRENAIIYDIMNTSYNQTIYAMIEVSYISYTMDKKGFIISGSRDDRVKESFEVVFKKSLASIDDTVKCPNCGAIVINNKCEYCRSIIKNEEYKIHSIRRIVK